MSRELQVLEEEWDFLIVLDACRFDYFKRSYRDFLNGRLNKVKSVGRTTEEWLKNSFEDKKGKDTEKIVYGFLQPLHSF